MLGKDLSDMRSGDLRKAIRRGDKLTTKVVESAAEFAGIGVANLINLLNPEIVVIQLARRFAKLFKCQNGLSCPRPHARVGW